MADGRGARPAAGAGAPRRRPDGRPARHRARRPALPIAGSLVAVTLAVVATVLLLGAHHGGAGASGQGARAGAGRSPGSPAGSTSSAPSSGAPSSGAPSSGAKGQPSTGTAPTSTTTSTTTAPTTTTAPPRPTGVGLARCTFVDPTRSTYDYATGQTLPGRTLVTELRYPTASSAAAGAAGEIPGAAPAALAGGYPTIFFAPGYDVTPDSYVRLLDAWVKAGFVVVAPVFPDTNPAAVAAAGADRYGYPENDLTNQPADLAFVIRSSLAASGGTSGCGILRGLIAPGQVAVAGQSDGGDTVALLAYGTGGPGTGAGAGLPIRAAAVLSGSEWPGDTYGAPAGSPPLLVVQSATDQCNPPQQSVALYDAVVQPDKWFLALEDADHLGPYDGDDASAFEDVVAVTTRFFRLELSEAAPSSASLTAGTALVGATLTTGPSAPALPTLAFSKAACAGPGPLRTS